MSLTELSIIFLFLGFAYSFSTLGFILVNSSSTFINYALGGLIILCGVIAGYIDQLQNLPSALVFISSVGLCTLILTLFLLLFHKAFKNRSKKNSFMATIALAIFIENIWPLFSNIPITSLYPKTLPSLGQNIMINFFWDNLDPYRDSLIILFITIVILLVFYYIFTFTLMGQQVRACQQDENMAQAIGISSNIISVITIAFGSAFCGIAGYFFSRQSFFIETNSIDLIVKIYLCIVLGQQKLPKTIIASFFLAFIEIVITIFSSYLFAEIVIYSLLIIVLMKKYTLPFSLYLYKQTRWR
ncbi:MAG: branched-chain amino acid ABC transporter permease [Alphaproteobacteria bacterium]|nr:branched-chain amino acid ABC transporter permease [Alphaproteobacteria bacterium]